MAKLSRGHARHLIGIAGALLLAPLAARADVDLIGTWHVLVHYTDDNSAHPDQLRWDDRVWVFERKASRLQWSEYPIVVFADESGRFERRGTGQYARVLGAWEPSEGQRRDIEDGLKINTRGSKKKSLRGSDAKGWGTVSRSRPMSASVITYQENWSIEGLPRLPVFTQEDVMGSGRSETMEGVTRWETTEVDSTSRVLRGSFERDGTRHGTFAMRRSGAVGMLDEKSQQEIQEAGFRRGLATSREARLMARDEIETTLKRSGITLSQEDIDAVAEEAVAMIANGADRSEVALRIEASIRERYAASQGAEAGDALRQRIRADLEEEDVLLSDEQLDAVSAEAAAAIAEGADENELGERIREAVESQYFDWVVRGASHDDSVRYRFPFESTAQRQAIMGVIGDAGTGVSLIESSVAGPQGRRLWERHSVAFGMPRGEKVVAARAGRVVRVVDGFTQGGVQRSLVNRSNSVTVLHEDGSFGSYWHLDPGIEVKPQQRVEMGDLLGHSGQTGYASEPMLQFAVLVADGEGRIASVPVRFHDGTPEGVVPVRGLYYGDEKQSGAP